MTVAYSGISRSGDLKTGTSDLPPDRLAFRKYRDRWQELTVTQDGVEVAWVWKRNGRRWWTSEIWSDLTDEEQAS